MESYILIGLTFTIIFVFSFLIYKISILNTLKVKLQQQELIWAPVKKELQAFDEAEVDYSVLQGKYKRELATLEQNHKKITTFNIGVGTVDSIAYISLMENQSADEIEESLNKLKLEIKQLVKDNRACDYPTDNWVNNRKSEGKKLINKEVKLRLRCFNNVCKSALALVSWSNISRLLEQLDIRYNDINASGNILEIYLQPRYLDMKKQELKLSFELKEAKAIIKQTKLEETRFERAVKKEAIICKEAFEQAQFDRKLKESLISEEVMKLKKLHGQDLEALKLKLTKHQNQLANLKKQEQRALSMAQQTRAGFVYIISNHQSFDKSMCKIGMTRRLDPQDRVKELGDASVPFLFDTHAFIYSEDAPTLEKLLHKKFMSQRVNIVNYRKEFFFVEPSVVLNEIEKLDIATTVDILGKT